MAVKKASWAAWNKASREGGVAWNTSLWAGPRGRGAGGCKPATVADGIAPRPKMAFNLAAVAATRILDTAKCKVNLQSLYDSPHDRVYHKIVSNTHVNTVKHRRPEAPYANICLNVGVLRCLAMFRMECSEVNVHTLFRCPKLERYCAFCKCMYNRYIVENEFHTLMVCPLFFSLRTVFMQKWFSQNSSTHESIPDMYTLYTTILDGHLSKHAKPLGIFILECLISRCLYLDTPFKHQYSSSVSSDRIRYLRDMVANIKCGTVHPVHIVNNINHPAFFVSTTVSPIMVMEIYSGDVVTLESSDQTHPRSIITVIPRKKEAHAKQRLTRKTTQTHPTVNAYKKKKSCGKILMYR